MNFSAFHFTLQRAANRKRQYLKANMSDDDSVSSTESIVEEKEVEEVTDLSNS